MHRKSLVIFSCLIFLFSSIAAFANENSSWEEKYKGEPYIVLLSEETVNVNKDCSTTTNLHIIKKVQKEGAKSLGEIPITYDKDCEEIEKIEAYTSTPDGKKIKCEKIQDLSTSGESSIYSDERVKMITMPEVVIGSTIDLKITKKRIKPVIKGNFYGQFYFSSSAPIKEARYVVTVPRDMHLNVQDLNFSLEPKVDVSGDNVTYTWLLNNSDKVDNEEYMPSYEEVYKSISVSTLKDWKEMADWNWPLFKKNIRVSPEMKKKIAEITAGKTSVEDKVQES